MNYSDTISQSIEFIEAHIKEELSIKEIATRAGYSVYHFCRIFTAATGRTVMDYIRYRRLSLARMELLKERKIIDVALDYGFETASGFTKPFHKEFGYSPTVYLARMNAWAVGNKGGNDLKPIMKSMPAFKVAGYGIKTNISKGYTKDIAAYWETYTGDNLEEKMYHQLRPPRHGEVGICVTNRENVMYLLGVIVEDFSMVTPDMLTVEVPGADYAVFTTPPVDQTQAGADRNDPLGRIVKTSWKYIFEEWFPQSGYVYDESKMDFEFYDERCHFRPDAVMEIYMPVKRMGTEA